MPENTHTLKPAVPGTLMTAMSRAQIEALIPHRKPMLLVDEVLEQTDSTIHCVKTFEPDEFFLQGHFPNFPLVPGVILCECCLQSGLRPAGQCHTEPRGCASGYKDRRGQVQADGPTWRESRHPSGFKGSRFQRVLYDRQGDCRWSTSRPLRLCLQRRQTRVNQRLDP